MKLNRYAVAALELALILPLLRSCLCWNIKPNIIIVVADDLGYTDVGFHAGRQIPTPNMDWLATNGILLENYYTAMICTPSRASLMTGRHPMQLGLQKSVIFAEEPFGLGLDEMIMPQYLKRFGYATHMIGKWHLGFHTGYHTPTNQGFDSHFGFWGGKTDYFSHENNDLTGKYVGLDFWENMEVSSQYNGSYGTELFGDRAVDLILSHNQSQPFFLYLAHQAVHNGIEPEPLKAPKEYLDKFNFIKHDGRRRYAAMLSVLDDSIGNLTRALKTSGMYDNSILVFTTDNGGPVDGFSNSYASNWPLRGRKATNWEGGVRGVAFIHSPLLLESGTKSHTLMHISDWLPTIMSAIGEKLPDNIDYYGIDQWTAISNGTSSPRREVLHNYVDGVGAVRHGYYKLVMADHHGGNSWYPHQDYIDKSLPPYIHCGEDPCEYSDISSSYPEMTELLYDRLMYFAKAAQTPRNKPVDSASYPLYHNGHWTNWKDRHPIY